MPLELSDPAREQDSIYERLREVAWAWRGVTGKGIPLRLNEVSHDSQYAGDFKNSGSSTLSLRARAGAHSLTVDSAGIALSSGAFAGNVTIGGTLDVTGAISTSSNVTAVGTVQGADLTSTDDVSVGDDLLFPNAGSRIVSDLNHATLANRLLFQGSVANVQSNVGVIPNGTSTTSGFTAYNNAAPGSATASMLVQADSNGGTLYVGSPSGSYQPLNVWTNNTLQVRLDTDGRLIVGNAGVALSSATDDKVDVIGGAVHIATDATGGGDEIAQGWRYGASGTMWTLWLDEATDPDLIWKDNSGTQRVRFMDGGLVILGTATAAVGTAAAGDLQANDVWLVNGSNYRRLMVTSDTFQISEDQNGAAADLTLDVDGVLTVHGLEVDTGPTIVPAVDPPTADADVTAGALVKASGFYDVGGAALGQNYNVASVAHNGAGDFTVTIDRDFSAASYATVVTPFDNGANLIARVNGQGTGSFDVHFYTAAGVQTDPDGFGFACFGTLS